MFFIGCHECPLVAQVGCNDRVDAMIASLQHERQCHPTRWNPTKEATLAFAIGWAQMDVVHVVEPQGGVC